VYDETLAGRGFGIEDARPSIAFVHQLRTARIGGGRPPHPSVGAAGQPA
jgi:hypothetical protein